MTCMFPGCYKIPIGISASGPNSRCHQQNKIRLNDVSLNCVIICHALIQYTLFLKCLRCMIFIGAMQHNMNPSRVTIPLIRPHQCYSDGGRIRGVLLYYHKITEYGIKCCMHVHLEAPRASPSSPGRIGQMQNFIFGQFSNVFCIQMGPGPTHPLPNNFWIFGKKINFAKPLSLRWYKLDGSLGST